MEGPLEQDEGVHLPGLLASPCRITRLDLATGRADRQVAYEPEPLPWGAPELLYAVREPFPSRHSHATLVFGRVSGHAPLTVRSRMAYGGVIFSDGMEADFLRFGAGVEAVIAPSAISGQLVVG